MFNDDDEQYYRDRYAAAKQDVVFYALISLVFLFMVFQVMNALAVLLYILCHVLYARLAYLAARDVVLWRGMIAMYGD